MNGKSIINKILKGILISGEILVDAATPYYALSLPRALAHVLRMRGDSSFQPRNFQPGKKSPFVNAFYYLKKRGYLEIEKRNKQIYIALTKEGRKKAGKYLIDDLKIEKPKKWDGKYRIVIFDIPNITRPKRDSLRGKLKELGFFKLQQSAWGCPYPCKKEMELLKEFFGLDSKEFILIEGCVKNDKFLRDFFKLSKF